MPHENAVVCFHCGFDQKQNRVIKTKVGTEEVSAPTEAVFVQPGRFGWKAPAIIGAALIVVAAVLSGMHADQRAIGHAFATLLFAPVYAGVGVAAVMLAAILMEQKFGRLEIAAGRMVLAVALVDVSWHAAHNLDMPNALQFLLGAGVGAGLYYLAIWWFFRLNRTVAGLLTLLHAALWLVFYGLLGLSAWLASPPASS